MIPVKHDTWGAILGFVYLILVTNLLLAVFCLPLVLLLITTDPVRSWPLLVLATPLAAPAVAAAFRAFREHGSEGDGPIRAFLTGLRQTWRRSLLLGAVTTALVVVLLVDVRAVGSSSAAVVVVPLLIVLLVLTVTVALLALTAIAEVPTARWRDVLRASLVLGVRRWYLTLVSLIALGTQVGVFVNAPALGMGLTASAAFYFAWTNSRFTLRPVLDLEPVETVRVR